MTKQQAYRFVRTALENRTIRRPKRCSRCGDNPGVAKDGRSKIHGHHHDYGAPLSIEWLCAKCHRADTPLPYGEKNGWSKLTNNDVLMIRKSSESGARLARQLGVADTTVLRVRNGVRWLAAGGER